MIAAHQSTAETEWSTYTIWYYTYCAGGERQTSRSRFMQQQDAKLETIQALFIVRGSIF